MFSTQVDLPSWVTIRTSEMGPTFIIGKVIATWHNNVKVQWWGKDNLPHIGIYSIAKHIVVEPTDTEWHDYYERLES